MPRSSRQSPCRVHRRNPSDAYAVFTGDGDAASLDLGSARLTLANAGGRLSIEAVLVA